MERTLIIVSVGIVFWAFTFSAHVVQTYGCNSVFEIIKTLLEIRHQLEQISALVWLSTFALGLPLSVQRTGRARSQKTTPISVDYCLLHINFLSLLLHLHYGENYY